jgi:hypothetical protein
MPGTTTAEILRKEMLAIGEMLSNGLGLEHELAQLVTDHPSDQNLIERWKESRRAVERLAEDYAKAVERYRQFVESEARLPPHGNMERAT